MIKFQMKWLSVAVASLALVGCRDDMYLQSKKCEFEAQKSYPNVKNMFLSEQGGRFIEVCMNAAGYEFNYFSSACSTPPSFLPNDASYFSERPNGYCYVPYSKWEQMVQKLESWLGRN